MKAKILITDSIGRFKAGEIGTVKENDFDKYDYYIELEDGIMNGETFKRNYYFYENEVEIIEKE